MQKRIGFAWLATLFHICQASQRHNVTRHIKVVSILYDIEIKNPYIILYINILL